MSTTKWINIFFVMLFLAFSFATQDAVAEFAEATPQKFGFFFLVDQYKVKSTLSWLEKSLSDQRAESPAGAVLWNFDKADATELRQLSIHYQNLSREGKKVGLLLTTDYEGGGMPELMSGKRPTGVQHFQKGFTLLPHPRLLGELHDNWERKEGAQVDIMQLALLFGRTLGYELEDAGIHSPLSVAADLAANQMWYRGLHQDPKVISQLLGEIFKGFTMESPGVFFTKHFPGLGSVKTNTHGKLAKAAFDEQDTFEKHLQPFRDLIAVDRKNNPGKSRLGIMVGHALYPQDKDNVASASKILLQKTLRSELGFEGLVISDAMWMGIYSDLHKPSRPKNSEPFRLYLKTFLAGVDMLMIKAGSEGAYFKGAVKYFADLYYDRLPANEWKILSQVLGDKKETILEAMRKRVKESHCRVMQLAFARSLGTSGDQISAICPNFSGNSKTQFKFSSQPKNTDSLLSLQRSFSKPQNNAKLSPAKELVVGDYFTDMLTQMIDQLQGAYSTSSGH